jgi:hypothetical protein
MRTPDEYAKDWNIKSESADSRKAASGADTDSGTESELGNPYRESAPPSPEWGLGPKGYTSYGHSDDCKEVNLVKEASKDMLTKGYERGEADGDGPTLGTRQPGGSFPAAIPSKNEWDRTEPYSNEAGRSNTGNYDGTGNDRSTPGGEQLGSTRLPS